MRDRIRRSVAAVALSLSLLSPAARAEDCTAEGDVDRLADLALAVEAALPGAATRAESRALARARDALARRGASFESAAVAFRGAARALDRIAGDPFVAELGAAFGGLRADLDAEVRDLREIEVLFPGPAIDRAKARIAALALRADAAMVQGKAARAACALLAAARATVKARQPGVGAAGGPLRVVSVDLDGLSAVPLNRPIRIRFSARLDPASVRADTVQVRRGPGFAVQAPGELEVRGPLVVFRPRLPVEADLTDAGFQGGTDYRVLIPGSPALATVRTLDGNPHAAPFTAAFHTTDDPASYFTVAEYLDDPPPRVLCTVPVDAVPAAPWIDVAGARDVPTTASLRLVLDRVPVLPASLAPPEVALVMTSFRGVPTETAIPGRLILEQDLRGVSLTFVPAVPLPDRSRFAFRVSSRVTDLSGLHALADHPARAAIHAQASRETETDPTGPLVQLALAHPLEIDPRTFLVFTTRDEAAADLDRTLAFDGSDLDVDGGDGEDRGRTDASFNDAVPGAVAAVVTTAGGDGRLGVLDPAASVQLDTDSADAPGGVFHYERIRIRSGVTVAIRGSRPAVLRSREDVTIDGTILATGMAGQSGETFWYTAALPKRAGGAGGPGGGAGGSSFDGAEFGMRGESGADGFGSGGGGGQGGGETAATVQLSFPGGGGGGGRSISGEAGSAGVYNADASYNGPGGLGGAGSGAFPSSTDTDDGREFSGNGGGGGGAGGNSHYPGARTSGAGGGGGGGALLLATAGDLRVSGVVDAGGGAGGFIHDPWYGGAPGGGGAGGTIALWASGKLDVTGARLRVAGGPGVPGTLVIGKSGNGADGYVRLEDADGSPEGLAATTVTPFAAATAGVFDPSSLATDPPSVFTGTWFLLPAFRPQVLPFVDADFPQTLTPGSEIRWEIQMADDSLLEPGKPDLGTVSAETGESTDSDRASGWVLLKDAAGIRDVAAALNGRGFQHFRIRISFRLPDGVRKGDEVPRAFGFRIRIRHHD